MTLFLYLFRYLGAGVLFLSLVIVGCLWLVQVLKFAELALNAHSSGGIFLKLTLLTLPDMLTIVLPIANAIALVFVYQKLMNERELIVMKAAGLSNRTLAKPAIVLSILLTGVLYVISLSFSPYALQKLRNLESDLKNALPAVLIQERVFNNIGKTTVYVKEKKSSGRLKGIFVAFQEPEKSYTIIAEEGELIYDEKRPEIVMRHGSRQELNKGVLSILYFDQTRFALAESAIPSGPRVKKAYELPLMDLLFPSPTLSPLEQKKFKTEGHQRLLFPAMTLVFSLMILNCMLKTPFSRRTQFYSILIAAFSVILAETLLLTFIHFGGTIGFSAAYALVGGLILLGGIGL